MDISVSWDAVCVPELIPCWGFWDLLLSSFECLCVTWGLVVCSVATQHQDFWWEASRVRKASLIWQGEPIVVFWGRLLFLFSMEVSVLRTLQIGNKL